MLATLSLSPWPMKTCFIRGSRRKCRFLPTFATYNATRTVGSRKSISVVAPGRTDDRQGGLAERVQVGPLPQDDHRPALELLEHGQPHVHLVDRRRGPAEVHRHLGAQGADRVADRLHVLGVRQGRLLGQQGVHEHGAGDDREQQHRGDGDEERGPRPRAMPGADSTMTPALISTRVCSRSRVQAGASAGSASGRSMPRTSTGRSRRRASGARRNSTAKRVAGSASTARAKTKNASAVSVWSRSTRMTQGQLADDGAVEVAELGPAEEGAHGQRALGEHIGVEAGEGGDVVDHGPALQRRDGGGGVGDEHGGDQDDAGRCPDRGRCRLEQAVHHRSPP